MTAVIGRVGTDPVRYSQVCKVYGGELRLGDWLVAPDHSGARPIHSIRVLAGGVRQVAFGPAGFSPDGFEPVDDHVVYDVVDPDSQVTSDGGPRP